jgi:hypothetical protein
MSWWNLQNYYLQEFITPSPLNPTYFEQNGVAFPQCFPKIEIGVI